MFGLVAEGGDVNAHIRGRRVAQPIEGSFGEGFCWGEGSELHASGSPPRGYCSRRCEDGQACPGGSRCQLAASRRAWAAPSW